MSVLKRAGLFALALILGLGEISSAPAQAEQPATPSITYPDLVKLLRTGKSETEILDTLSRSPIDVNFVFGAAQVDELKKMRLSDEFIDALKKLRPGSVSLSSDVTDLVLILDCSGSMSDKTKEGPTKMEAAKQVLTELIREFPKGRRLALIVYGHDLERKCQAVDVIRPLSELDDAARMTLQRFIANLKPVGHTPIANALELAVGEVVKAEGMSKVVLITDGMETCHGDPVKAAQVLVQKAKTSVEVIGFVLTPEESKAVHAIAKAGRGKYYDAQTVVQLRKDLREVAVVPVVAQQVAEPMPPAPVEKVSAPVAEAPIRAIRVLAPKIQFPPMKELQLVESGKWEPGFVFVNSWLLGKTDKYGQEIRVPRGQKFDLVWKSASGQSLVLAKHDTILQSHKGGPVVELRPEDHLGLVRITGKGLPEPKDIRIIRPGAYSPGTVLATWHTVASSKAYNRDMVVPAGSYDIWLWPADGGRAESLGQAVDIKPGRVTEID